MRLLTHPLWGGSAFLNIIWSMYRTVIFFLAQCVRAWLSKFSGIFDAFAHYSVESLVFDTFLTFFFLWKLRCCFFFKNEKDRSKGGSPEAVFWLEFCKFSWNFQKIMIFRTKIQTLVIPLLISLFHFWKRQHLSFHWKTKIVKKY